LARASVPLSSQQQQIGLSPATVIARQFSRAATGAEIVVLNAAAGGSGLVARPSQGSWEVGRDGAAPDLRRIASTALETTLQLIGQRRPGLAVEPWLFWHQGEADQHVTEPAYASALDGLATAFRAQLGDETVPFVAGGLVPEFGSHTGVRRALANLPARLDYAAFAPGIANGGGSSGAADDVHYTRQAVERLGASMFEAARRAAVSAPGLPPQKPLDVAAHVFAGRLHVAWSEPLCRWTGFLVEYRVALGEWVEVVRELPAATTEIVPAIPPGPIQVRVATANGPLVSGFTSPADAVGSQPAAR
jgi:hypothetical protein